MIELTPEQAKAVTLQKEPLQIVNPLTQDVYVLVRQDVYKHTFKIPDSTGLRVKAGGGP